MQKFQNLLMIGVDPSTFTQFEHLLKNVQVTSIPLLMERVMAPSDSEPNLVIVSAFNHAASQEVAQILKKRWPKSVLFLLTTLSDMFDQKSMIDAGYVNAFLIPKAMPDFQKALSEHLSTNAPIADPVRTFKSVKMPNMIEGEILTFDLIVFLPSNNKYVRILNAGDPVDLSRLEKINTGQLYVPSDQMQKFYDYSALKLKSLAASKDLSKSEKKELLVTAVKELMSGLFTEEEGAEHSAEEVMKNCSGIVSAYISTSGEAEWYSRIQQVLAEFGDQYSHSANVSTLAALFSIGLNIGSPEEIALAGLLHDIGKIKLPEDVQLTDADNMTAEQTSLYHRHPELSIEIIKQKKLKVAPVVLKAIIQHHEIYSGGGFPKRLFGPEICKEAQLVAIADWFDQLTKPKKGKPPMRPAHAVEVLRIEVLNDNLKKRFDPILLKSLLSLFPQPSIVV